MGIFAFLTGDLAGSHGGDKLTASQGVKGEKNKTCHLGQRMGHLIQ